VLDINWFLVFLEKKRSPNGLNKPEKKYKKRLARFLLCSIISLSHEIQHEERSSRRSPLLLPQVGEGDEKAPKGETASAGSEEGSVLISTPHPKGWGFSFALMAV